PAILLPPDALAWPAEDLALALLMPLLVLAMPASLRIDLPGRLAPRPALEDSVAHGSVAPAQADALDPAALEDGAPALRAAGERSLSRRVDLTTLALGAWALGTAVCALRLARAGWRAARLRRRAEPSTAGDDVVVSADVQVPMVTGVLRPAIVLPPDALAWPAEDLALALLHERAHVARHDVPKQWAASLACAVYWFNPLAWIVARTMATDREHAVDAVVLERGARASSYAALLVRVASRAEEAALLEAFHTPAVGRADLTCRVEAVLATPRGRASRRRRAALAATLVLAAVAVACGGGPAPASAPPPAAVATVTGATAVSPCKITPSAALLEKAIGGESSLDDAKQRATEQALDEWLAADPDILHAHVVAMELPSGFVVALAGRDRAGGATTGLERAYPPGSTIKPLLIAAALEAGAVKEDDVIDGQGGTRELLSPNGKKHVLTDWTPQASMSLAKLLALSSNVGASKVAERLGAERVLGAMDTLGLFRPVDLEGAAPASRPTNSGDAWHDAVVSIGHDFSVSPLRLVAAYGALASDGEVVNARLRPTTPRTTSRFVSPATARKVTTMLEGVVAEGGTGKRARVEGLRVAGKT
ncbi:MAG TPA: penicillin-binding transpeptidase domain-containing protein, partial [Labilithrix sp.]|nr:penicillin-binding transpeptidase domain-containing protein [Labilithrix sp.]